MWRTVPLPHTQTHTGSTERKQGCPEDMSHGEHLSTETFTKSQDTGVRKKNSTIYDCVSALVLSQKHSLSKHALAASWHDFNIINRWLLSRKLTSHTHTHTGTVHTRADELLTDAESGPNAILSSMDNPRVRKGFWVQAAYPIIYQINTFHENKPVRERQRDIWEVLNS